jgi:hypothetical protein
MLNTMIAMGLLGLLAAGAATSAFAQTVLQVPNQSLENLAVSHNPANPTTGVLAAGADEVSAQKILNEFSAFSETASAIVTASNQAVKTAEENVRR